MPQENESAQVLMVHKDFKDRAPTKVGRKVFERTWKPKGWVEFKGDPKEAEVTAALATEESNPTPDK
jgi:hypothetical protein